MKEEWRHDVEVLKAWVAKATEKNDPAKPGARILRQPGKTWLRRKLL